jgi:hypothetical protein
MQKRVKEGKRADGNSVLSEGERASKQSHEQAGSVRQACCLCMVNAIWSFVYVLPHAKHPAFTESQVP